MPENQSNSGSHQGDTETAIHLENSDDPDTTSVVVIDSEWNRDVQTADELEVLLDNVQLLPGQNKEPSEMQNEFARHLREARAEIATASGGENLNEAELLAADVFRRVSGTSGISKYAMQHLFMNGESKFDDNSFVVRKLKPGGGGNLYLVYHHTHGICVAKESKYLTLAHYGRILAQKKRLEQQEREDHENVERFLREQDILETTGDELIFPRLLEKGNRKVVNTEGDSVTSAETHPYYLMEYIPGLTLSEWIVQERKVGNELVSTRFVEGVALRVLSQLGLLHDKYGITHRDIKPGNLIVSVQGDTRILDPGLAYQEGMARLTQTGQVLGTPGYLGPDQAMGAKDATTAKTDLYSLGCTLLELATSDPVMRSKRIVTHLSLISDGKSLLRQCSKQLEQITEKNPRLAEAIRCMLLGSKGIGELIEFLYPESVFDDGGHFADVNAFRTAPVSDSHLRLDMPEVDPDSSSAIDCNADSLHSHVTSSSEIYRETKVRAKVMGIRKRTVAMIAGALGVAVVVAGALLREWLKEDPKPSDNPDRPVAKKPVGENGTDVKVVDDPPEEPIDDTPFIFETVGEGELPTSIDGMSYFHDGKRIEISKKDLIRYMNTKGELIGAAYPDANGEPAYVFFGRDGRRVIVRGYIPTPSESNDKLNPMYPDTIILFDSEDGQVWENNGEGDRDDAIQYSEAGFGNTPPGRYNVKEAENLGNPSWAKDQQLNPRGAFAGQGKFFSELKKKGNWCYSA